MDKNLDDMTADERRYANLIKGQSRMNKDQILNEIEKEQTENDD